MCPSMYVQLRPPLPAPYLLPSYRPGPPHPIILNRRWGGLAVTAPAEMVQDGSDRVRMCPHGATAYSLQAFHMVPVMVQDGSDMVQMCTCASTAHSLQAFRNPCSHYCSSGAISEHSLHYRALLVKAVFDSGFFVGPP